MAEDVVVVISKKLRGREKVVDVPIVQIMVPIIGRR